MTAMTAQSQAQILAFPDRRASARQACAVNARVVQCGFEYSSLIINISAEGACLISPCRLTDMQLLRLDIDGFGGVTAVVRWTAGGETGVEFQTDQAARERLEGFLANMVTYPRLVSDLDD